MKYESLSFNMKNGDPLPKQDNTQRRQKAQSVGHMQTLDFSGYTTLTMTKKITNHI